jgi:hypothetical protein
MLDKEGTYGEIKVVHHENSINGKGRIVHSEHKCAGSLMLDATMNEVQYKEFEQRQLNLP